MNTNTSVRNKQFSIALTNEAKEIVDRYTKVLGISRGAFLNELILDNQSYLLSVLNEVERLEQEKERLINNFSLPLGTDKNETLF